MAVSALEDLQADQLQALSNSLQLAYRVRAPRKSGAVVIDKLDIRVPSNTPFHPTFARLYADLRSDPKTDPFHSTRLYTAAADLRMFGYDAILHMGCKHGQLPNHKLELVDTGSMSLSRMVNEIESIFDTNAMKREIMRTDLAADIEGVPVSWFQNHVKAQHKRYVADFGSMEFVKMGKGGVQTFYLGKRPNFFRIYDKHGEYQSRYAKIIRGFNSPEEPPTFEEMFHVRSGIILTRVERQLGGRIPDTFRTVASLKKADAYRPFDPLRILRGTKALPDLNVFSFMEVCTGLYLKHRIEAEGMHGTIEFLNRYSRRNTKKYLEKFRDFIPDEHPDLLSSDFLNDAYRDSVSRQIAA